MSHLQLSQILIIVSFRTIKQKQNQPFNSNKLILSLNESNLDFLSFVISADHIKLIWNDWVQISKYHRKGSTVSNKFSDFQDKYIGDLLSRDLKWTFLGSGGGGRVQPPKIY